MDFPPPSDAAVSLPGPLPPHWEAGVNVGLPSRASFLIRIGAHMGDAPHPERAVWPTLSGHILACPSWPKRAFLCYRLLPLSISLVFFLILNAELLFQCLGPHSTLFIEAIGMHVSMYPIPDPYVSSLLDWGLPGGNGRVRPLLSAGPSKPWPTWPASVSCGARSPRERSSGRARCSEGTDDVQGEL